MHQDAALRASCRLARKADQIRLLALEAEFRRVMEDEDRSLPRRYALARRLEMTAKNIRLVDPLVGEESISAAGASTPSRLRNAANFAMQ